MMKFDEVSQKNGENFGKRLKRFRLKNGLTQMQLATSLDMSNVQITRYEKNITRPTVAVIKKLSRALSVRYEDLAGDLFESENDYGPEEIDQIVDRLKRLPQQDIKAAMEVLSNYVRQKEFTMISSV